MSRGANNKDVHATCALPARIFNILFIYIIFNAGPSSKLYYPGYSKYTVSYTTLGSSFSLHQKLTDLFSLHWLDCTPGSRPIRRPVEAHGGCQIGPDFQPDLAAAGVARLGGKTDPNLATPGSRKRGDLERRRQEAALVCSGVEFKLYKTD